MDRSCGQAVEKCVAAHRDQLKAVTLQPEEDDAVISMGSTREAALMLVDAYGEGVDDVRWEP